MADVDDVSGLLKPLVGYIKSAAQYVLTAVKCYYLVALLVFVGIVGYAVYQKMNRPVLFEGKMACFHLHLSKKEYAEMLDKLSVLVSTNSYQTLAAQLNIPVEEAKTIRQINGQNTAGAPLITEKAAGTSPFYINLRATQRPVFASFEKGIIDYLNRMPFRSTRNIQDQERQAEKEAMLRNDINLVDSVVSAYIVHMKSSAVIIDSSAKLADVVPLLAYKEGLEDRMLDQKLKRSQTKSVELFESFIIPDNPSPIGPRYGVKAMAVFGLFFVCLSAVLCSLLFGGKKNEKKPVYEQSAVIQSA